MFTVLYDCDQRFQISSELVPIIFATIGIFGCPCHKYIMTKFIVFLLYYVVWIHFPGQQNVVAFLANFNFKNLGQICISITNWNLIWKMNLWSSIEYYKFPFLNFSSFSFSLKNWNIWNVYLSYILCEESKSQFEIWRI